jgi:predicted metalloprotease with PDZ domain
MISRALRVAAIALLLSGTAAAQNLPTPSPMPADIAAPQDIAYPGTLRLDVDATDIQRRIFNVRETIPVRGGATVTLHYPKWLPGTHSPRGRIEAMAGLIITGGGARLEWRRDVVDVYAFHVDVPANVSALDLEFQYLTANDGGEGRVVMTQEMMNLQWEGVTFYPAGHYTRRIPVDVSVKLPPEWKLATALETASTNGDVTTFKTTTVEDLVDSPMFAGRYFKQIDLGMTGNAAVRLNIVADRPELLDAKPQHIELHKNLVTQAHRLFGSHHYDHYDFLLALTDRMGGIGLEHHQSSENGVPPTYFTEWEKNANGRDLLPHEYTHSWNGKFRRPADLWTPTFNVPMRDSLLWVYEGQTQYWGYVLSARSGLLSREQTLAALADIAATYEYRIGRRWKALQDTTNDPITAARRPLPWRSWQRSEDYYSEGLLVWLDADTLIRDLSKGKKSLDDFAKTFFGVNDGSRVPVTYTFEDLVAALNSVQPYDWAKFLRERLDNHEKAPLDGVTRGGYRLVFKDTQSDFMKAAEGQRKYTDLTYSLGIVIGREAKVTGVLWEGPAFKLGITTGTQIVAVNNTAYESDRLKDAITAAKNTGAPLELLVRNGDKFRTVKFDYRDGLRYPHFERESSTPDRLGNILGARKN